MSRHKVSEHIAKNAAERAKRLRPDGIDQYLTLSGGFAHMNEDPFTDRIEREPYRDHVTVAVIGGGFAGLMTGAHLKEAGVADVRIVDTGGDFGGTWYWNRYPGAQCDIASMIYLPLLEETGYVPTEWYVHGPEILEHCQRIGKQYGLYEDALFHTRVTGLEWDESARLWTVRTDRGDEFTAQFVSLGLGHLSVPKLPGIPGIETFAGQAFHASRWDYAYTGDPVGGPLGNLRDKRVAIIGTGATAVQCIPHLATACQELLVFQRTPSVIEVRNNRPIDPEWFARTATPGWQQRWLDNYAANMTSAEPPAEDLINDGWTAMARMWRDAEEGSQPDSDTSEEIGGEYYADMEKMGRLHARVDETVKDSATAELLKPWYHIPCKRMTFHDEYLDAYNVPAVRLVDTDGKGVERITPRGVVVDGTEYEVDCIIYASGFEVGTAPTRRAGFDPVGRDGRRLSEYWTDGMRTMHGLHVHGFPNAFLVQPLTGGTRFSNLSHNLSEAARTVAAVVAHAVTTGAEVVEVTRQAEDDWMSNVGIDPEWRTFLATECTPGYSNNEGMDLGPHSLWDEYEFPDGLGFFRHLQEWRSSRDFDGLEFNRPTG
ncbi:NAD(P)/FAD-dependent oxidoreductase [Streptomyces europaeiscabiei]|uniref:flavin-containing monooxygenase n=1 Tax=Streptomyces europaeiscabiei TaxID=146819 RepID=UPI002E2CB994|nr:NAD(P)/FAD-dependent oxidoreductase [Streptomyces europaeiscabiei]